jgi:xanthine dehydrogenase YagS FAD-binding subunit
MATLDQVANHQAIRSKLTALAQAAQSVGTPQIRNQGTVGGNLCQRPRCWYYRNPDVKCLKKGGDVCFAPVGENKYHAIFGGNPVFIVHPSDLAPALITLNARVTLLGPQGRRTLPLEEFFILPAVDPTRENVLAPNELVAEVQVPPPQGDMRSVYHKFKEKETMDFALSAAAVALTMQGGVCQQARIVLGGVATIPWPVPKAAALLVGQRIDEALAAKVAEAALEGAEPLSQNAYKIPLTKTVVRRAILEAAGGRKT